MTSFRPSPDEGLAEESVGGEDDAGINIEGCYCVARGIRFESATGAREGFFSSGGACGFCGASLAPIFLSNTFFTPANSRRADSYFAFAALIALSFSWNLSRGRRAQTGESGAGVENALQTAVSKDRLGDAHDLHPCVVWRLDYSFSRASTSSHSWP